MSRSKWKGLFLEKSIIQLNNKKKRKLIEMNEEAFQSYELSLKIAKCCKVVCF
jgi:hypothetical protein